MLPSESPPLKPTGPGITVNVHSAAVFLPGHTVLAPFEFAREVWLAFNEGSESWKTYLETAKGRFTAEAFANLSSVPPLERAKLALSEEPLLRLVPPEPTPALETEALSPTQQQMLAELRDMTSTLLVKYGLDPGLVSLFDGDDAAR